MDENEMMEQEVQEQSQDQADAFMDGFEELDAPAAADQRSAETEGEDGSDAVSAAETEEAEIQRPAEGTDGQDAGGDETDGQSSADAGAEEKSAEAAGQTWEVNHLGQRKTMRAGDITPELLQKGLDYDRIHQQYDRTKPIMSLVSTLARQAGVSVEDYVRTVRTEAKMSGGLGEEEAKRAVDLEDREAAVAAKEAEAQAEVSAREGEEARIQRDIAEFAQVFPEVYEASRKDPGVIPDSVWEAVRGGLGLTAAYARHAVAKAGQEVKEARSRAQTAEQNRTNAQRSAGSMRSAGSDARNADAFLSGFEG